MFSRAQTRRLLRATIAWRVLPNGWGTYRTPRAWPRGVTPPGLQVTRGHRHQSEASILNGICLRSSLNFFKVTVIATHKPRKICLKLLMVTKINKHPYWSLSFDVKWYVIVHFCSDIVSRLWPCLSVSQTNRRLCVEHGTPTSTSTRLWTAWRLGAAGTSTRLSTAWRLWAAGFHQVAARAGPTLRTSTWTTAMSARRCCEREESAGHRRRTRSRGWSRCTTARSRSSWCERRWDQ